MKQSQIIFLHLLFWTSQLLLRNYMFHEEPLSFNFGSKYVFDLASISSDLGLVLYFYVQYLWLIHKYLLKKKYKSFIVLYFICTLIFIPQQIWSWHGFGKFLFMPPLIQFGGVSFAVSIDTFTSLGLRLYEYWANSQRRRLLLEKELKETEIFYLKSQMSPHFLFNTLNNIYALSLKGSTNTVAAVGQLRTMMIYVKQLEERKRVSLGEEISYLNNFIALNKLRFDLNVEFLFDNFNKDVQLEPMLLQPFIENAFKHGRTGNDGVIKLSLTEHNGIIEFRIENKFDLYKRKDAVGGIGLVNIQRRLILCYPNQHKLVISHEGNNHIVNLIIHTIFK